MIDSVGTTAKCTRHAYYLARVRGVFVARLCCFGVHSQMRIGDTRLNERSLCTVEVDEEEPCTVP